ncbi:MAG TPA: LemA family protein [Rhizomicrobium sp.]|jgi:LemA protein|nr:LemA family protein [Rhizomicrobium sp.]
MVLYIVIGVVVLIVLWAIMTYNGLVSRRAMVAEGWSGIDAQLKRRTDLIPNLVETVKGYATHERSTFDELTKMRAETGSQDPAQRAAAETAITSAIGKIMAVAEAYPDLKASANFQSLQQNLNELEDQIQLARRYYNGAVRNFNVSVQQFPSNLIAGMGGFTAAQFFQLDDAADRNVPKVSFS